MRILYASQDYNNNKAFNPRIIFSQIKINNGGSTVFDNI